MFSFHKPTEEYIRHQLEAAGNLPLNYGMPFVTEREQEHFPTGYVLDHTRSEIGRGTEAFAAAKAAMRQWKHFDLGWISVANPEVAIEPKNIVVVEAHSLGLWSLNLSRILYVINEPTRFGFAYGTTPLHVERGEERFLLEYDPATGSVHYDLLAISQPANWLVRLAYPYTRSQQHRFARESHQHMQALLRQPTQQVPSGIPPVLS